MPLDLNVTTGFGEFYGVIVPLLQESFPSLFGATEPIEEAIVEEDEIPQERTLAENESLDAMSQDLVNSSYQTPQRTQSSPSYDGDDDDEVTQSTPTSRYCVNRTCLLKCSLFMYANNIVYL